MPKNGIGMAFWIAGVPGSAVIVNVNEPRPTPPGSGAWECRTPEQRHRDRIHRRRRRTATRRRRSGSRRPAPPRASSAAPDQLHDLVRDRAGRARIIHQLAEHRAEQETAGRTWRSEVAERRHEGLGVVMSSGASPQLNSSATVAQKRRDEDDVPAAVREKDQRPGTARCQYAEHGGPFGGGRMPPCNPGLTSMSQAPCQPAIKIQLIVFNELKNRPACLPPALRPDLTRPIRPRPYRRGFVRARLNF